MRRIALLVILKYATSDNEKTIRALAKTLGISKPAISQSIDVLSKHKLVMRMQGVEDKRDCFVHITERGIEILSDRA